MTFKKYCIAATAAGMFTISAVAQTSAAGAASGNASVTPGQANAGVSTSQSVQTPGASANASSSGALSSGTVMQAELAKSVDAKKAKSGDQVEAKLTQDVKSDGKVVLHKGSKLIGHVTEVQAKSKENAESKLGVVFDKAVLKGGEEVSFNGVIQAIAPPVQGSLSAAADESSNAGSGMGSGGGGSMGGGRNGGVVGSATGSVSPVVGSTVGAVGSTAGSVGSSATGAVNNSVGAAAHGALNSTSQGVVGLQGLALNTTASGSTQSSVLSSASHNVKLDGGTQMILQVTGAAAAK